MTEFSINTPATRLNFEVLTGGQVALTQLGSNDLTTASFNDKQQMVLTEVQVTGENIHHKGVGFVGTEPGSSLHYVSHREIERKNGKTLEVIQKNIPETLLVTNH